MRGLDARVLLAQARTWALADAAAGDAARAAAEKQAEWDGWQDAADGVTDAPLLFSGETLLLAPWERGQQHYGEAFPLAWAAAGGAAQLDQAAWRAICARLGNEAGAGCGQSYEWYVACFSGKVERAIRGAPPAWREAALAIAHEYGYATRAQLAASEAEAAEDGYCQHGIALGHCPVGCE